MSLVETLLKRGDNVDDVDDNGRTPLMLALNSWNIEVIETLLKRGANINAVDNDGRTPLIHALSIDNNYSIIETLLKHGADISIEDSKGTNAVDHTIMVLNSNDKNYYDELKVMLKILENMERYDLENIEMLLGRVVEKVGSFDT